MKITGPANTLEVVPLTKKRVITRKRCYPNLAGTGLMGSFLVVIALLELPLHKGMDTVKFLLFGGMYLASCVSWYQQLQKVRREGPFEEIVPAPAAPTAADWLLIVVSPLLLVAATLLPVLVYRTPVVRLADAMLWVTGITGMVFAMRSTFRRNKAAQDAVNAARAAATNAVSVGPMSGSRNTQTPVPSVPAHWWTDSGTRAEVSEQRLGR